MRRAPEPASAGALPGAVQTRPLVATETCVRLSDLPAPFTSESARRSPNLVDPPANARLEVPPGFVVQRFAEDLAQARWLAETPDGRVLVVQSKENRITWLADRDHDGVAEERGVLATDEDGLDIPFGVAFHPSGNAIFIGNQSAVRRYSWRRGQRRLEGQGTVIAELPGGGYRQHWTRNVITDGERLFVSVGSRTNVEPEEPPRASVLVMGFDGSGRRVFASGLRNPVGLAIHPTTRALYATVNERDHLGDDLVPDYLAQVVEGGFYGWPYAYLAPDRLDPRRMRAGGSEQPELARRTRTPEVLFQAHSAALGLAFDRGPMFPAPFRHGAFVAFRGSWNRSAGTGYMVVHVPFEGGRPTGCYAPFLRGFLIDPSGPDTWGRPVGTLFRGDGSLLFTEEAYGVVFRVSYPLERPASGQRAP